MEKPLACSVAEARQLVGLARERGLVLMVDHT
jgi:predicted dehydrogenase